MQKLNPEVTDAGNFYMGISPVELAEKYGSPLYVYNENILRERCREMKSLIDYKNFKVNYSAKANSNVHLLKIIREEGLDIDAMSPGEILAELKAGFKPEQIFFISNNVSAWEMKFAVERNIKISVDSLSQLELYGKTNPGGKVAVRINPGVGAGHHKSVITGGSDTKFGINVEYLPQIMEILKKYNLSIDGINTHIGSLFMEGSPYIKAAETVLAFAKNFDDLDFADFGGGYGIPYRKQEGEARLDLKEMGARLSALVHKFVAEYGKEIAVKIEPGRYITAECGVALGTVHAVKHNGAAKYAGTDIGFNALARPVMYDAYHEIEVYRGSDKKSEKDEVITIVGNICETGDVLAKDRKLPQIFEEDIIGVLDAGAYGFVMSSSYNQRPRAAEVLICADGSVKVIREREKLEDLHSYSETTVKQ